MGCSCHEAVAANWSVIPEGTERTIMTVGENVECWVNKTESTPDKSGGRPIGTTIINASVVADAHRTTNTKFILSPIGPQFVLPVTWYIHANPTDYFTPKDFSAVTLNPSSGYLIGTFDEIYDGELVEFYISALDSTYVPIDTKKYGVTPRSLKIGSDSIQLIHPLPGADCTSIFSEIKNSTGGTKAHKGLDFSYADGRIGNVVSSADGEVVAINGSDKSGGSQSSTNGYGLWILIKHLAANGQEVCKTFYAHLDSVYVHAGQKVASGQAIGKQGNTGGFYRPHLHYEVHHNGKVKDPLPLIAGTVKLNLSKNTSVGGIGVDNKNKEASSVIESPNTVELPVEEAVSTPTIPGTPTWMNFANTEIGITERTSTGTPRIIEYHKFTSLKASSDSVPWCSSFVNWVMKQDGQNITNSAAAKSWQNWGYVLEQPRKGAITLIQANTGGPDSSTGSSSGFHVGFYMGENATHLSLLGGNQADQVKISSFKKSGYRVVTCNWPVEDGENEPIIDTIVNSQHTALAGPVRRIPKAPAVPGDPVTYTSVTTTVPCPAVPIQIPGAGIIPPSEPVISLPVDDDCWMPYFLTHEQLCAIMPKAQSRSGKYLLPLNCAMKRYNINTKQRAAAFLAQIAHESGELGHVVENLNYSESRLMQIFPKYFKDGTAPDYASKSQKIGSKVYANRMGNSTENSQEGWFFKGRGCIQITGKYNYTACGNGIGVDCLSSPELLETPENACLSAAWFWSTNGLNSLADINTQASFNAITKKINGGTHGTAERTVYWEAAKNTFGI